VATSGLGHGSGRVQAPSSTTGLRASESDARGTGLRIARLWLPNGGALRLWVGEVERASVRLSNGRLTLWSPRQRQAHQARCAPRLPDPERLQLSSSFGGGSDLLGEPLGRGFRGLVWRSWRR